MTASVPPSPLDQLITDGFAPTGLGSDKAAVEYNTGKRLIDAAPELLRALQHVAGCARGTSGRIILEDEDEEIVLAAIRKATGV